MDICVSDTLGKLEAVISSEIDVNISIYNKTNVDVLLCNDIGEFCVNICIEEETPAEHYLRVTPKVVWIIPEYENMVSVESNTSWITIIN